MHQNRNRLNTESLSQRYAVVDCIIVSLGILSFICFLLSRFIPALFVVTVVGAIIILIVIRYDIPKTYPNKKERSSSEDEGLGEGLLP
jgi:Na+/H+ antiporter NhaD/arsenite permease-like protein